MPGRGEAARLQALGEYGVLDSPADDAFDRITALAADLFDAPFSLVSLVDAERLRFVSSHGAELTSAPRFQAFCDHAITLEAGATFVVEDASRDPRFQASPSVAGETNLRFYAGAVLTGADGFNLGALCVLDTEPRPAPSARDLRRLQALARIVVDELELRRATRMAAEKKQLLDLAERMSGVGHWRYEPGGDLIWSEEVYRIHGVSRDSFDPAYDDAVAFYDPEDRARVDLLVAEALRSGTGYEFELRIRRPDGEYRYVTCKAECLLDEAGAVTALCGVFQDVTERKNAESAIARSEAAYRTLADNTTDILVRFGPDGVIRYISPACRALGVEPEDAIGQSVGDLVAPGHAEASQALVARLFSGAEIDPTQRRLHKVVGREGQDVWLEGSPKLVRDEAGKVVEVVSVLRDVTAKLEMEQALADSEQRFRSLAVNAPDIINEMTLDGVLTYMSPACLKVTGFTPEELIGRTALSFMHPEDAPKVRAMCETVLRSGGKIAPWPVEFRARHKSGRELWLECKPTPLTDPITGRFTGMTDIIRDITSHKALETELRQARNEAESAAAVKGEFLANMSHELRTPLTSIVGFTRLAADQPELSELTRTFLARVEDASRALLCTVNDILDFSKLEAGQVSFQPEPVILSKLCRGTLDLFTPQAGAKDLDLRLEGDAEAGDLAISVDPDRIRQILLNLVGNAVKFTDAGAVTLRARYDRDQEILAVDIIDTGAGISPARQDLLFKRFSQVDGSFTRAHGGTGLGLAICKGLVEAMGGEIGVESREGDGSRFWFRVPAKAANRPEAAEQTGNSDHLAFIGVRVLVVDDHPANRELARLFLSGVGAEVSEADDGETAVQMASEWPVDVILMDLRMPRLDGLGALRRIREGGGPNDAVPILAFTADADAQSHDHLVAQGFDDVVAKPLEPGALITAIARATAFELDADLAEQADVG